MVFKTRKVPKHLIIREEYELRRRPRFGVVKFLLFSTLVLGVSYIVSIGMVQL